MSDTLGSLRQEILLELRGDLAADTDVPLLNAKINNALEAVWMAMMKVQLARFFGSEGPVSFTLAAGAQRVQLVSIPDPTAQISAVADNVNAPLPARVITLTYTYVTESGSETNLSTLPFGLGLAAGQICQVNPPPKPSGGAFGWNLYAQSSSDPNNVPVLQNQQPLPFGVVYTEPITGFQDYPNFQQLAPTSNATADNISYITHLEIQTSDTTLHAYNQYDIDSLAMRGLAATLASASEYQTYAWDLINGNTIEIRPPAGSTLLPRYFYVAKPRRLRYDQAEIPYQNISGVHEFLTNKAIADLKLTIDEYISAQAYVGAATSIKAEIISALAQENWAKNTRVTPFLF